MITHPVPERKQIVFFSYYKATEFGGGGEKTEQDETKIQTDTILDKFKIKEEM